MSADPVRAKSKDSTRPRPVIGRYAAGPTLDAMMAVVRCARTNRPLRVLRMEPEIKTATRLRLVPDGGTR